jgi:hypothetical protein
MDYVFLPVHQVLPEKELSVKDANLHVLSVQVTSITVRIVWMVLLSIEKSEDVNKAPPAIMVNTKLKTENV